MTEYQHIVDEIRSSMKTERGIRYTLKTPKTDRMRVMDLTFPEIEQGAALRYFLRKGYTIIDREPIEITVGTTPETETPIGGYGE